MARTKQTITHSTIPKFLTRTWSKVIEKDIREEETITKAREEVTKEEKEEVSTMEDT